MSRDPVLEKLVIKVIGGMAQVRKIAALPDLPKKMQPDALRELARYLIRKDK